MFGLTPREVESLSRRKSARNWSEEILSQKMAIPDAGRACCAPLRRFVWRRKRERRVHSRLFCVSPMALAAGATFGNENALLRNLQRHMVRKLNGRASQILLIVEAGLATSLLASTFFFLLFHLVLSVSQLRF